MVIVGAGECGGRAALALRENGYRGPVTLVGREPHPPYERPPLSKQAITLDHDPLPAIVGGEGALAAADIRLVSGREARSVDRRARLVVLDDGTRLPYAKLLIAAGAAPRRLDAARGSARCVYLRTFADALAIRGRLRSGARLVIVGGGFIGLELAAAARRYDCPVTIIEAQPRILMRGAPAEIAEAVHAAHAAHGVRLRCGSKIAAIEDTRRGVEIRLAGGEAVAADLALVGVGAAPETTLASACGLTIDNGVAVDRFLMTDDPDIFAAGDCCSFPLDLHGGRRVRLESWRNAQEQGALAAGNMLGGRAPHAFVPWFWSDQYDLGLQVAGLVDEGRDTVRRDLGGGAFILFHLTEDGRLVAASGVGPGNAVARDIRLAEMLIARRATPPREKLAAPETRLKSLLAA